MHSTIIRGGDNITLVAIHNGDWSGEATLRIVDESKQEGSKERVVGELIVDGSLFLKLVGCVARQAVERYLDDFDIEKELSK